MKELSVGVGGLGGIGMPVVEALARGIDGLRLAAVSVRDVDRGARRLEALGLSVPILPPGELGAHADIIVECLPPALFESIARPAVEEGRVLIVSSVGQLLGRRDLIDIARIRGGRILVSSGALVGLDGVRASVEGVVYSVRLVTRKPPSSLAGAQTTKSLDGLSCPLKLFAGTAAEAIEHFPKNVNVAASLVLAGASRELTVEIWADPTLTRNVHRLEIDSDAGRFTITIEGIPSSDNPATSRLAALSVVAALRKLTSPLVVGA